MTPSMNKACKKKLMQICSFDCSDMYCPMPYATLPQNEAKYLLLN